MIDDRNTKSLIHFNSDSPWVDESGKTWTNHAHTPFPPAIPTVDIVTKKFNAGSVSWPGFANSYMSTPSHADFNTGTGPLTIDFQFRVPTGISQSGYGILVYRGDGINDDIQDWLIAIDYDNLNCITWLCQNSYGISSDVIGSVDDGLWHHFAGVRDNSDLFTMFIDGIWQSDLYLPGFSYNNSYPLYLGGSNETVTLVSGSHGNMDEFRFSNIDRWTSDFPPPSQEYGPADLLSFQW